MLTKMLREDKCLLVTLSTCYGYSQSIFAINGMVFLCKTVAVVILPDLTVETLSESGKFIHKW